MSRMQVRTSRAEIVDYFNLFLTKKPQGVINESHVSIMGPELAAHYGIYTFTLTNPDGSTKNVSARFSYTYRKEGGKWLITAHHSSALPEVPEVRQGHRVGDWCSGPACGVRARGRIWQGAGVSAHMCLTAPRQQLWAATPWTCSSHAVVRWHQHAHAF